MYPPLRFSGIRRFITAIACTGAIAIIAGCSGSSSPDAANSSPNQSQQAASTAPTSEETAADQRATQLPSGLAPKSLSYWDVTKHAWAAAAGNVPILVGASSADIRLNGTVQAAATTPAAAAPATPAIGSPPPATNATPTTSAPSAAQDS